jgi:hypothetical protein
VWDPTCHNIPLPGKAIEFLRSAEAISGVEAVCDFWGNRQPFIGHANHEAMRAHFDDPSATDEQLLHAAAKRHYSLAADDRGAIGEAVECWAEFGRVVDEWALTGWAQRLSFAVGRDAARGRLYRALVPPLLRGVAKTWECRNVLQNGRVAPGDFARWQEEDRERFQAAARRFDEFASALSATGNDAGPALAAREARNIELAGELIASVGRTVLAAALFERGDWQGLRRVVEQEIDAREAQLELSARAGVGAGVHPLLVREDIQNMRLFLASDEFPHVPDDRFHFTPTPFSV